MDQEKIMQLILLLAEYGARIKKVTGDHYAKDYIIPQCTKRFGNECADYFSVDLNVTPHLTMLNYMKKNMYSMPYYERLDYELNHLLMDLFSNKVDHPHNADSKNPTYWKDCSDALAGASYHLYTMEQVEFSDITKEQEEIDLESDDFYSSISLDEDELDEELAEELEMENSLWD